MNGAACWFLFELSVQNSPLHPHQGWDSELLGPRKCETLEVHLALYIASLLLTVGWLRTRGWTCDRGRMVMDWMPRLRNVVNREERRTISLSQEFRLVAGKMPSQSSIFILVSQHLDGRKRFLLCFFSAVETAWNDPLRRLVKLGLWVEWLMLKTFLDGCQAVQRLVERCWTIFKDGFQNS